VLIELEIDQRSVFMRLWTSFPWI